jgi:hypothetical protein
LSNYNHAGKSGKEKETYVKGISRLDEKDTVSDADFGDETQSTDVPKKQIVKSGHKEIIAKATKKRGIKRKARNEQGFNGFFQKNLIQIIFSGFIAVFIFILSLTIPLYKDNGKMSNQIDNQKEMIGDVKADLNSLEDNIKQDIKDGLNTANNNYNISLSSYLDRIREMETKINNIEKQLNK